MVLPDKTIENTMCQIDEALKVRFDIHDTSAVTLRLLAWLGLKSGYSYEQITKEDPVFSKIETYHAGAAANTFHNFKKRFLPEILKIDPKVKVNQKRMFLILKKYCLVKGLPSGDGLMGLALTEPESKTHSSSKALKEDLKIFFSKPSISFEEKKDLFEETSLYYKNVFPPCPLITAINSE